MSDLISRQAALEAIQARADMELADINHNYLMGFQEAAEAVESVPDAQPEERTNERTETHACDLIDRQAAIDDIKAVYEWHDTVTEDRILDHLYRLPSAQPERKKGRWIKVNGKTAINCSACYHCSWSLSFEYTVKRFNFCPNCGADMRGEQNERNC